MRVSTVQAFKSLASKIHPQLPLTPRESQRLLNALTTSFRQHLDKGHAGTEVEGLTKSENLSKRGHGDVHVGMPKSSSVSAATHLETILTNPLLSRIPSKSVVAVSPDGASLSSSKEPQRTLIDAFEDVAAQGAATVETAAYALQTIKRQLSKLPADAVKPEAMRLGAAAKVLL
ncbi:hypothetical protein LTR28_001978, partial [Elasticomyces elasticus]